MSIIFLIISLVFVVGYMGFIKFLWSAMSKGGMFDMVSGARYTLWMDGLYSGSPKQKATEKFMGGCEQCTSFWWFLAYLPIYIISVHYSIGWNMHPVLMYVWFVVYWFICSLAGLHILTYNKK